MELCGSIRSILATGAKDKDLRRANVVCELFMDGIALSSWNRLRMGCLKGQIKTAEWVAYIFLFSESKK